MAPLFSNKSKASNKITLSEYEKLIMNDKKCAEVFNNYFNSVAKELNIAIDQNLLNYASMYDDPIKSAVHKYKRHPSSLKIKEKVKNMTFFLFIMSTPIKCLKFSTILTLKKLPSKVISESESYNEINSLFQNFYLKRLTITLLLKDLGRLILSLFKKKMILLVKLRFNFRSSFIQHLYLQSFF